MKRVAKITIWVVASIMLAFLLLHLGWRFTSSTPLHVYILDKTVTKLTRPEHKSLVWVLNHERFSKSNTRYYSNNTDYYGFFPIDLKQETFDFKSIRINEVDEYSNNYDALYYADCYGVQSFEWYKGKAKPIQSQKVFGGLNQNDYLLMKSMLDKGKLVIAEYNMFSTPTNALVRIKTEELLEVTWKGWSGKFFTTFNTSAPQGPPVWMKNLFESQHLGTWPTDKKGIILINNDGLIEVLIQGEDLNQAIPTLKSNNKTSERFGVAKQVNYEKWFEFIDAGSNKTLAHFNIDVSPQGAEKLQRIGLKPEFPAVIERSVQGKAFYFCGDFAENPAHLWTAKLAGGSFINHFLNRFGSTNEAVFFKQYYQPLVTNILKEYAEQANNNS